MATKWMLEWGRGPPVKIDVVSETDKSFTTMRNSWGKMEEGRRPKSSHPIFDNFEAAKAYLITRKREEITRAEELVQRLEREMDDLDFLKEPAHV